MQSRASRVESHVDLGEVRAESEHQEQEVLRTHHQERVYDVADVYVLARLDEIQVMLDAFGIRRRVMTMAVPRNAAERHAREHGHRLAFGCCRSVRLVEAPEAPE